MPSSISNFEPQPPDCSWRKVWAAAGLACLLCLVLAETLIRAQGERPSVADDKNLWCYWRNSLRPAARDRVVLVGSSRMHLGVSLDAWKRRFNGIAPVQLAIEGSQAGPVLRDLANDPQFAGTVVCELSGEVYSTVQDDVSGAWVHYYHDGWAWPKKAETLLEAFAEERLALLNERYSVPLNLKRLLLHQPLRPDILKKDFDRDASSDFSQLADLRAEADHWLKFVHHGKAVSGAEQQARVREAAEAYGRMVRQIEARGGAVVFVRFPTSGKLLEAENAAFPRAAVWDEFARLVPAKTIHFEDVPSLKNFTCPDESHLDRKDTGAFTVALAEELVTEGVLDGSGAGVKN